MKQLTIAIDFDNTFTAVPEIWQKFIHQVKKAKHRIIMVTARRNTQENCEIINDMLDLWDCQMPIVFTELGPKIKACEDRGIKVDIWIDDDPCSLVNGH